MKVEKVETGYLEENCYVISKDGKCLIIDPGDDFYKIKSLVGNKKVLAVLVTHYHFDHVGALNDVKKYYNIDVIDYKSNEKQVVGPFSFDIIETKGHKEDSVTYYFKEDNIMFVGDFIFKGTIGRCDLEGGSFKDMKKSVDKIKGYGNNIKLYPGHGPFSLLGEEKENNPYMKGDINE